MKHLNLDFAYYCGLVSCRQRQIFATFSSIRKAFEQRCSFSNGLEHLRNQNSTLMICLLRSIRCLYGTQKYLNAERIMSSFPYQLYAHADSERVPCGASNDDASSCNETNVLFQINPVAHWENPSAKDYPTSSSNEFQKMFCGQGVVGSKSLRTINEPCHADENVANWGFWQPRRIPLLKSIQQNDSADSNEGDSDERLRKIMTEQDRCLDSSDSSITSQILHVTSQLFPKEKLLIDIEYEIRRIINDQIIHFEKENLSQFHPRGEEQNDNKDGDDYFRFLDEDESQGNRVQQNEYLDEVFHPRYTCEPIKDAGAPSNLLGAEVSLTCPACRRNPCQWKSPIDETHLDQQRAKISEEIIFLKKDKTLADPHKMDRLQDLRAEANRIDTKAKLNRLDKELHDIYCFKSTGFVKVRSLHGYDSLMTSDTAIDSLQFERDRLIAALISHEMLDGILDWYVGLLNNFVFSSFIQYVSYFCLICKDATKMVFWRNCRGQCSQQQAIL